MVNQILSSPSQLVNDFIFDDYSKAYDLMLTINPAYQLLLRQFEESLLELKINKNKALKVLDIGAGTGNFSRIIQDHFPFAHIDILEPNEPMSQCAKAKLDPKKTTIINREFQQFEPEKKYDLIICIHALYLMKNPKLQIPKIKFHLKKTGNIMICDIGKTINVINWSFYIYGRILLKEGFSKMKTCIEQTMAIKKANISIQNNQKEGIYWNHNLKQFRSFLEPFFKIKKSFNTYRNHSRFVVAGYKE